MYDSILVPTDGSEHALRAAKHGRMLSRAFDATLHVITVVDVAAAAGPFDAGGVDTEFVDRLEEMGRETVQSVEDALDETERLRTDVTKGRPSDAIFEYADANSSDLIVTGTHGRSGLNRYFAGSVAERVVRLSEIPVITVRAAERSRVVDGYENILVPTDGSEHAVAAADNAIAIGRASNARIHAVHVVDVGAAATTPSVTPPTTLIEQLESEGERSTESIAKRARDAGLDVTTDVFEGSPARDLLEYADENEIDLVATGTAGRTGLDRYLVGSTTEQIIRRAEMPVLSVTASDRRTGS